MKLLFVALLLVTSNAFAHFKIGTYKGIDSNNAECSVEFKKISFVNNVKNPINERVDVVINGSRPFVVTHLPVIDSDAVTVTADKENLTAVEGGVQKAVSLQIHMDHSLGGPESYTILEHDWLNKTHDKKVCLNLEYQE